MQVGQIIIPTSLLLTTVPLPVTGFSSSFDRRLNAVRSTPATATSIFMHQLRFGVVLWPICKLITLQRRELNSLLYGGSYSPCTSIRSAFIHDHSEAHDDGMTLPFAGHLHWFRAATGGARPITCDGHPGDGAAEQAAICREISFEASNWAAFSLVRLACSFLPSGEASTPWSMWPRMT